MIYFDTVSAYNAFNQHVDGDPLITLIDLSTASPRVGHKMYYGIYAIFLKQVECGDLQYGKQPYDYQEGTLVFVGPGQVIDVQNKTDYYQPKGYVLAFHPDFLQGSALAKNIKKYPFFHYGTSAALHMSEEEKSAITFLFQQIKQEVAASLPSANRGLVQTQVHLLLEYCVRFYERQYTTRKRASQGILERLEALLHAYADQAEKEGPVTVAYCADRLSVSPNYLGDLIKKETGRSALDVIQDYLVQEAKARLNDPRSAVAQVAYSLGFKYPQHFIRLFKKKIGVTPREYQRLNSAL